MIGQVCCNVEIVMKKHLHLHVSHVCPFIAFGENAAGVKQLWTENACDTCLKRVLKVM